LPAVPNALVVCAACKGSTVTPGTFRECPECRDGHVRVAFRDDQVATVVADLTAERDRWRAIAEAARH
jgi:hypothetical protein